MSVVRIKDVNYLRVDWSLGASKNNIIKYYEEIINLLKELLQNSPFVVYIVEYMKHMPLYYYYVLPNNLNGNLFRNMYLPCCDRKKNSSNKNGVENFDCQTIENVDFVSKFMKLIVNNKPYIEINSDTKQNIFYLFSKFALEIPLTINKTYFIPNSAIRKINEYKNHEYLYSINILLNPRTTGVNDNFDVDIQKFRCIYDCVVFNVYMDIINENYINNMYYTINFSQNREFYGQGLKFIHPWLRDVILKNFPTFYNAIPTYKYIKINSNKLNIIYHLSHQVASSIDEYKEVFLDIPDELNNVFVFVKRLSFKLTHHDSNEYKKIYTLTIGMRKN